MLQSDIRNRVLSRAGFGFEPGLSFELKKKLGYNSGLIRIFCFR